MTPRPLFSSSRTLWSTVTASLLATLALVCFLFRGPDIYRADARISVAQSGEISTAQVRQQVVASFSEQERGLLKGDAAVNISRARNAPLPVFTISATHPNRAAAVLLANRYAEILVTDSQRITADHPAITALMIDRADFAGSQVTRSLVQKLRTTLGIAALAALIVFGVIFTREHLHRDSVA